MSLRRAGMRSRGASYSISAAISRPMTDGHDVQPERLDARERLEHEVDGDDRPGDGVERLVGAHHGQVAGVDAARHEAAVCRTQTADDQPRADAVETSAGAKQATRNIANAPQ